MNAPPNCATPSSCSKRKGRANREVASPGFWSVTRTNSVSGPHRAATAALEDVFAVV
jgi:hypothetical protein